MLHDSTALQQQNLAMPAQTSSNGAGTANGGMNNEAGKSELIRKFFRIHSRNATAAYFFFVLIASPRRVGRLQDSEQLPSLENRQAKTTHLRNMSAIICTFRTSQASRTLPYKRETFRVPRMHKMFCPSGPAVTASAKAAHDNHSLFKTTKSQRKC